MEGVLLPGRGGQGEGFRPGGAALDREGQQGAEGGEEEGGDEEDKEAGGRGVQRRSEDSPVPGGGQTREGGEEEGKAGCGEGKVRELLYLNSGLFDNWFPFF